MLRSAQVERSRALFLSVSSKSCMHRSMLISIKKFIFEHVLSARKALGEFDCNRPLETIQGMICSLPEIHRSCLTIFENVCRQTPGLSDKNLMSNVWLAGHFQHEINNKKLKCPTKNPSSVGQIVLRVTKCFCEVWICPHPVFFTDNSYYPPSNPCSLLPVPNLILNNY